MLDKAMRSYYAAYNAEDEIALEAHLADDVLLISSAGTQEGKGAYLATYRYMIENFVDRMTPEEIIVVDDVATVRIADHLTAKVDIPDFLGAALVAGQTLTLNLVGRYSFSGSKIVKIELAAD